MEPLFRSHQNGGGYGGEEMPWKDLEGFHKKGDPTTEEMMFKRHF